MRGILFLIESKGKPVKIPVLGEVAGQPVIIWGIFGGNANERQDRGGRREQSFLLCLKGKRGQGAWARCWGGNSLAAGVRLHLDPTGCLISIML